jgi:hypothetical protein
MGHYLDSRLSREDSPGDEGAIFASLVQNQHLGTAELHSLKQEDDHATLNVEGQVISVELNNDSAVGSIVAAVNTGGPALTQDGIDFAADDFFLNGNTFTDKSIGNGSQPTFDDTIYETERYGDPLSYEIPVDPGNYAVELHFAEIYQSNLGDRTFDVEVEGQLVLDDLDILAETGGDINQPFIFQVPSTISPDTFGDTNAIDLDFSASVDNAKISGIVIHSTDATQPFEQDTEGLVSLEAEQYHNRTAAGDHEWTLVSDSQASGTEAMQATPDNGTRNNTDYVDSSPRLDYTIEFNRTGQHYIWVLGRAAGDTVGSSNSVHIGLDGQEVETADRIEGFEADFDWSNDTMDSAPATIDITSTGIHTLNLWMREDGFMVDRVILATDPNFDPMQPAETPKAFEQDTEGLVSLEAEQYHNRTVAGDHEWTLVSDSQASGGEVMQATPDNGTRNNTGYADSSPRLDYTIEFNRTGQHYVWVLGSADGGTGSNSLHVGLNGQEIQTADRISGFEADFGWSNATMDSSPATINIASTGVHTLNLWMREDGFMVDQVILAADPHFDPTSLPNPDPSSEPTSPDSDQSQRLEVLKDRKFEKVIESGFEPDVRLDGLQLEGTDNSVSSEHNNWSSLNGKMRFNLYDRGDLSRFAIVADPLDSSNNVFLAEIVKDDGVERGRAQGTFYVTDDAVYDEFYSTYRVYFPKDWQRLKEMDPHGWTGFFEMWTKELSGSDCDTCNGSGSFRMKFYFLESSSTSNKFIWELKGQEMAYKEGKKGDSWIKRNNSVEVPFGKWATYEVYVRQGPDPKLVSDSPARFIVRMKPDGGEWQTLFDVSDERTEHSSKPQDGYLKFQPVKNYTKRTNIDFMLTRGLRPAFFYDDIKFYVGSDSIDGVSVQDKK